MNIFKTRLQRVIEDFFLSILSLIKIIVLVRKRGHRITDYSKKSHFIILGNGPSLEEEINKLDHRTEYAELICVNHFPSTGSYEKLKPKIYVTGAPDLWLDEIDAHFVENSNVLFKNIAKRTTWELQLFIPFEAKKFSRWQSHLQDNPNVHIRYYNINAVEGFNFFNYFCYKRQLGMPRPHNVLVPCMSLSIQPHVNSILLMGVGHTWLKEISVTENNDVLINQKHFYDKDSSKPEPLDKRGRGKRNLYELLSKLTLAFYGYFVVREYADTMDVKIYNGTKGSYIDAFERIAIDQYLEKIKEQP